MHPDTRRAALRATARLALSVTVGGCQSAAVSRTGAPAGDLGQATVTDIPPSGTDIPPSGTDVSPACDPGVTGRTSVACCTAQLDRAVGDAGRAVTDPGDIACCRYLATQNDVALRDGGGGQNIPYRSQCCQALGWQGSITCTPWGPPVPPEMPGEAMA